MGTQVGIPTSLGRACADCFRSQLRRLGFASSERARPASASLTLTSLPANDPPNRIFLFGADSPVRYWALTARLTTPKIPTLTPNREPDMYSPVACSSDCFDLLHHGGDTNVFLLRSKVLLCGTFALAFASTLAFGQGVSAPASAQISGVLAAKSQFTDAQKKIDSNLVFAAKVARGELAGSVFGGALRAVATDAAGLVTVDIQGTAVNIVAQVTALGSGVKVGVLSNSANATRVAALIVSRDLSPSTTVLAGQGGAATDDDKAPL